MAANGNTTIGTTPRGLACRVVLAPVTAGTAVPAALHAQVTTQASVGVGGVAPNGPSGEFSVISADGRFVAFGSASTNLVAGDANGTKDIFVRDLQLGTTTLVSVATDGTPSNDDCTEPLLGGSGRFVAFSSWASNLVANDTNGAIDVFVRDRDVDADGVYDEPGAVTTTRMSVSSGGAQGDATATPGTAA